MKKKNKLKRGQKCDIYLTHVCRQPWSVERSERTQRKQELSANTVAFTSCRSRLTIMLACAGRGEKGSGG